MQTEIQTDSFIAGAGCNITNEKGSNINSASKAYICIGIKMFNQALSQSMKLYKTG